MTLHALQVAAGPPEKAANQGFPRKQPSGALVPGELIAGSKSSLNKVEPGSKRKRKQVEIFNPAEGFVAKVPPTGEPYGGPSSKKKRKGKATREPREEELDPQTVDEDEFLAQLANRPVGVAGRPSPDDETETESEEESFGERKSKARAKGKPKAKATAEPSAAVTNEVIEFYSFVQKRHEMWRQRRRGAPPEEWSSDAKLRQGHFCNVYRELDRGTVYLQGSIRQHREANPAPKHPATLILVYSPLTRHPRR